MYSQGSIEKTKAVLFIGGASRKQLPQFSCQANQRGLKVVIIDVKTNFDHVVKFQNLIDEKCTVSSYTYDVVWPEIDKLSKIYNFVCCLALTDKSILTAARIANTLSVPHSPVSALQLTRNKFDCRTFLSEKGFSQPEVFLCFSLTQALETLHKIGGPAILKPVDDSGSSGVQLVRNIESLRDAFKNFSYDTERGFILEAFQNGQEYSIDGFILNGSPVCLAVARKCLFDGPNFIESGHVVPASISDDILAYAKQSVSQAIVEIGLSHGFFHVEFWIDGDQVVLGEIHGRPGGDYLHLLSQLASGVELYGPVFEQALGHHVSSSRCHSPEACAVGFLSAPAGRVVSISGIEAVVQDSDCILLDFSLNVGDHIAPLRKSSDRPGCVIARGATPWHAEQTVARLIELINIEVENEFA
ncbi:ATP-grasp domain-containing protein [Vibrio spartinae]|uniref:Phosphoribosylglycinamide formyltransferase 2 n=1 Tax=Vibrio spartinae TaxID=1918945 RepID=A0ABX6R3S6_9VIBR|nr:ATP-grasp domain-containing protein [Vibrio spartinae]QMV16146.1 Phosphoribosylglycinamide formyltransferase 2 [Vibrio spartinae]